eukprot:3511447-Amphidinium_carterae.1
MRICKDIGLELIRKERLKENGLLANMQQEDYFELVKEVGIAPTHATSMLPQLRSQQELQTLYSELKLMKTPS